MQELLKSDNAVTKLFKRHECKVFFFSEHKLTYLGNGITFVSSDFFEFFKFAKALNNTIMSFLNEKNGVTLK